jgi:CubicO group peptidase (beta-lactamase class C family)
LLQVLNGLPPANSSPIRVGIIPGTKNQYSGGGFTIIQQLIIDVTGQSFDNYMKDSIFDKLGMASSTFEQLPPEKWDFAAHGYGYAMPDGKSYEHKEMRWKWNNFPEKAAAGLWTTAGDLALYMIDLQDTYAGRSSKVISKESADKMFTLAPGEKYLTLGLVLLKFSDTATEFRFSGTNVGYQCGSFGTVNTGQGCVIMYNDRQGEMFPEEIKMIIAKEYGWPK